MFIYEVDLQLECLGAWGDAGISALNDAEIVQTISSEASTDQHIDEKITAISEATAPNLNLNPDPEDSTPCPLRQ